MSSELKQTSNEYRVATFITCVGQDVLDVYNGLTFETEEGRTDMNTILTLMEKHCVGETNVIYERYVFNSRMLETKQRSQCIPTYIKCCCQFLFTENVYYNFVRYYLMYVNYINVSLYLIYVNDSLVHQFNSRPVNKLPFIAG